MALNDPADNEPESRSARRNRSDTRRTRSGCPAMTGRAGQPHAAHTARARSRGSSREQLRVAGEGDSGSAYVGLEEALTVFGVVATARVEDEAVLRVDDRQAVPTC